MFKEGLAGGLAVAAVTAAVGGGMLLLLKRSRAWWRKRYREPFHEGILRPPGWGCLERRQDALFDAASLVGALPVFWAGLAYVAITSSWTTVVGAALAGVPWSAIGLRHLTRSYETARTSRLGFLGECAVAEALVPLLAKGWRVFHDIPMEVEERKFNIDHVAVGPGGVWAIETKSFSKAQWVKKDKDSLRVEGEVVVLPDGRRSHALKQANGFARALQMRCNEAGAPVRFVEPLVVLPGWKVNYPRGASHQIRDPRNVVAFLESREPVMDGAAIDKVAAKLEEWCRVLRFEGEDAS